MRWKNTVVYLESGARLGSLEGGELRQTPRRAAESGNAAPNPALYLASPPGLQESPDLLIRHAGSTPMVSERCGGELDKPMTGGWYPPRPDQCLCNTSRIGGGDLFPCGLEANVSNLPENPRK
ncbi:unnamed protein product [Gadus morhua 'NCC']